MIYEYRCDTCGDVVDVIKPAEDSDKAELCDECGSIMAKQFCAPQISVGTFKEDYYHAFGKHIGTKRELRNELDRHKYETGKELIEVGNENLSKHIKKPVFEPNKEEAARELRQRLRNG